MLLLLLPRTFIVIFISTYPFVFLNFLRRFFEIINYLNCGVNYRGFFTSDVLDQFDCKFYEWEYGFLFGREYLRLPISLVPSFGSKLLDPS
jgi:hypothetical protein